MMSEHWQLDLGWISVAFFILSAALPKSISAGELGASLMGRGPSVKADGVRVWKADACQVWGKQLRQEVFSLD